MSSEIAAVKITPQTLREIGSFADAIRVAMENNGADIADDLGDGFSLLNDKRKLIGVRFIILDWAMIDSDKFVDANGVVGKFASMRIVTEHNDKLIVNDGSAGIRDQLAELDAAGKHYPHNVSHGLRVSEYSYTNEKGEVSPASTFYLDTSK